MDAGEEVYFAIGEEYALVGYSSLLLGGLIVVLVLSDCRSWISPVFFGSSLATVSIFWFVAGKFSFFLVGVHLVAL